MKSGGETKNTIRRLLFTGSVSVFLHIIIAAFLFIGKSPANEQKIYRVEVKRLQPPLTEKAETIKPAELPKQAEIREEPDEPPVVDITAISAPISIETAKRLEEALKNAEITVPVEMPAPPAENAIIAPGGGLGSGADDDGGGGNSLLASGTGRGWGGAATGEGWGGVSRSPGAGRGTGGGRGSGSGNSRVHTEAGGEGTSVYFAGMSGIIPPVYTKTSAPNYPEASRKRGEEGNVLLKVEVLTNGRVGQTEIAESSGFQLLDDAALNTVRKWRFKPALKEREEVACWVNIPIKFKLR